MSMFESVAKFFATLSPRAQRVQDHRPAVQLEQPSTPPRSRPGRNSFPESDDTQPEVIFVRDAGTTAHPEVCFYPISTRVSFRSCLLLSGFLYNTPTLSPTRLPFNQSHLILPASLTPRYTFSRLS
jgi:hypothetical protein